MQSKKTLGLLPIYANSFADISNNFKLELLGNLLTITDPSTNTKELFGLTLTDVKYYGSISETLPTQIYVDNPGMPFEYNTFIFRDLASFTFPEKFSFDEIISSIHKFNDLSVNDGYFFLSAKDVIYNLLEYLHSSIDFKTEYENIYEHNIESVLPYQIGGYKSLTKDENTIQQTTILASKQNIKFINSSLSTQMYLFRDKLSENPKQYMLSSLKAVYNSGVNWLLLVNKSFYWKNSLSIKLTYSTMFKYQIREDCFQVSYHWYNPIYQNYTVLPHIFNATILENQKFFDTNKHTYYYLKYNTNQLYNKLVDHYNKLYNIYFEPNAYPTFIVNNYHVNLETFRFFMGHLNIPATGCCASSNTEPPTVALLFPLTAILMPFKTEYFSYIDKQYKQLLEIDSITTENEIKKALIDGARLLSTFRTSASVIDLFGQTLLNFRRIYQQPIDKLSAKYINSDGNTEFYQFDTSWFIKQTDTSYCRQNFDYSVLANQIYPIVANSQFISYYNQGLISLLQPVLVPKQEQLDITTEDFTTIEGELYYLYKRPSWNGEFAEFIFNLNTNIDNALEYEAGFNNDLAYSVAAFEAIEDLNNPKIPLAQKYYQLNFTETLTDNTSYVDKPFVNILTTPFEKSFPVITLIGVSNFGVSHLNMLRKWLALHTRLMVVDLTQYTSKQQPNRTLLYVLQPENFDRLSLLTAVEDSTDGNLHYLTLLKSLLDVGNDVGYFDITTYDTTNFGLTQLFIFENDLTKPLIPPKLKLRINLNQTPGWVVYYPIKPNSYDSKTGQPNKLYLFNLYINGVDKVNKSVKYDYKIVKLDLINNQAITLLDSATDSTIDITNEHIVEFFNEYYPNISISDLTNVEPSGILTPIDYQLRYLLITNYTYVPVAIFVKDNALSKFIDLFDYKVSSVNIETNTNLLKHRDILIAKLSITESNLFDIINTNLKYKLGAINNLHLYINSTLILDLQANQFNILTAKLYQTVSAIADTTTVNINWTLDSSILPELIFEEPKAIKVSLTDQTTNDTTELILDVFNIYQDSTQIDLTSNLTNYNLNVEIIIKE